MVRTPRSQTKNKSFSDFAEEESRESWAKFVERFITGDHNRKINLVGCKNALKYIDQEIKDFLGSSSERPEFLLVSGPKGSGKTTVISKSIQPFLDKPYFHLDCCWINDKSFGDPRQSLKILNEEARLNQPSLIYIQDIDAAKSDIILDFLKGFIVKQSRVLIIAETRDSESLDPRLLGPEFFSYHLKLTLPQPSERLEYINNYLSNIKHGLSKDEINQVVASTHCHSYADLDRICHGSRKNSRKTKTKFTYATFETVMKEYKPRNIASTSTPCMPLTWDQIGGVEEAKAQLKKSLIDQINNREKYANLGAMKIKGGLLYGPPGCSKTLLGRALATESGFEFIYIKGPEIVSKYVGDSEAELRKIYRRAMDIAPCIIFIDEIDCLAPTRTDKYDAVGSRLVTTLLLELDGATETGDVFTIGATNRPLSIDKALLRPGRLTTHIYIPLPPESDREAIFRIYMGPIKTKFDLPLDEILKKLAAMTPGFSGAEIALVCDSAVRNALDEDIEAQHVEFRHFEEALKGFEPQTDTKELKSFETFARRQTTTTTKTKKQSSTIGHDHDNDNAIANCSGPISRLLTKLKMTKN